MKTQKLKPIACVLAVSLFLAGCNGGHSTADGASNSLQAAQAIVNNNDANHAAFIERVKNAVKGPANYEVINRNFYTNKNVQLAFDPNTKASQLANGKSVQVDTTEIGLSVVSGAVEMIPGVGPILSFAVEHFGADVIAAYSTPEAIEYDPNSITEQLSRLQNKVAALEQQMTKTNNIFYQSLKEQSTNSVNSAQNKLFSAMAQLSYGPNLDPDGGNCALSTSDLAYHYFGYSGLGFDEFGTSCNSDTQLDFMGIAKDLAAYSSDLNISISDKQSFANALENVSAAKIAAGYNGDFSKVVPITNANQSVLIQVLDSMFTDLKAKAPTQGTVSTNYADIIAQYDASLLFILQSAYNSLQGAYAIEHMNNYLNFLAAVNALQTNSKATIPQISGYEGIQAINFELKKVNTLTLKDLEDDYINKENNLLMLYTARTNIMFNTVMSYIVSDKPLSQWGSFPAKPDSYKIGGVEYKFEVPLRDYSKMYPEPKHSLDIPALPAGNWKSNSILYSWNGYSNYYACSDVSGGKLSEKNCALYPKQESGFYNGDKLFVQIQRPATANVPSSLSKAITISTDWYVGSLDMPFKLSSCSTPATASITKNPINGSLVCDSYHLWEPSGISNKISERIFNDASRSSKNTPEYNMEEFTKSNLTFSSGWSSWKQFVFSENGGFNDVGSDKNAKFNGDTSYSIKGDVGYTNGYFSLISQADSKWDYKLLMESPSSVGANSYANYMLNTKFDADAVGYGGSFVSNVSCPINVDAKTDLERYNSNTSIQPSYISCQLIKSGVDDAIYDEYVKNFDLDKYQTTARYPAMVTYDGSSQFVLYSIQEKWGYRNDIRGSSAGVSSVELVATAVPCSKYPDYCKK